jgi:ABC-type antimicrobial peptide transport system permease subunit
MYLPHRQLPVAYTMTVALRVQGDPTALAGAVRAVVRELDAEQPIGWTMGIDQKLDEQLGHARLRAVVTGTFAVFGLLLAAMGVYGTTSYWVVQRTQEIGIRITLGASVWSVVLLVLSSLARPLLIGIIIGSTGIFVVSRLMSSVLFGVEATDPVATILPGTILLFTTAVATFSPARNAVLSDPAASLRHS